MKRSYRIVLLAAVGLCGLIIALNIANRPVYDTILKADRPDTESTESVDRPQATLTGSTAPPRESAARPSSDIAAASAPKGLAAPSGAATSPSRLSRTGSVPATMSTMADETTFAHVPAPSPTQFQVPALATANTITHPYIVQHGDTLSSIAVTVYGSAKRWLDIQHANPVVDATRLKPGQRIVLPPVTHRVARRHLAADRSQYYTVRPGDTLSAIARVYYGSGTNWTLIYRTNREKIGPDPDQLEPGTTLELVRRPKSVS